MSRSSIICLVTIMLLGPGLTGCEEAQAIRTKEAQEAQQDFLRQRIVFCDQQIEKWREEVRQEKAHIDREEQRYQAFVTRFGAADARTIEQSKVVDAFREPYQHAVDRVREFRKKRETDEQALAKLRQ